MEDSIRLYHRPDERVSVFPAPTNPVRCSDELLTMCRDLAERHDLGIHTHLLESKVQTTLAQQRYGRTMVQQLERLGLLSSRLSCAHTIWIEQEDIERLAATGTVVVHNPESNLKLGTGIAPIGKMLAAGVTERERSKWVTARQALAMATEGGARAVQLPNSIGRIQAGYRADVVLYDLDTPAWTPFNDPVQQMVFAETGSSVHTVIVDG